MCAARRGLVCSLGVFGDYVRSMASWDLAQGWESGTPPSALRGLGWLGLAWLRGREGAFGVHGSMYLVSLQPLSANEKIQPSVQRDVGPMQPFWHYCRHYCITALLHGLQATMAPAELRCMAKGIIGAWERGSSPHWSSGTSNH